MSEISAIYLGRQIAGDILALKLRQQQDQAVIDLVEKAIEPLESPAVAPAGDRIVDIVV